MKLKQLLMNTLQNTMILIISSILGIIISNLIQKTAAHYFINIIPNYYIILP